MIGTARDLGVDSRLANSVYLIGLRIIIRLKSYILAVTGWTYDTEYLDSWYLIAQSRTVILHPKGRLTDEMTLAPGDAGIRS